MCSLIIWNSSDCTRRLARPDLPISQSLYCFLYLLFKCHVELNPPTGRGPKNLELQKLNIYAEKIGPCKGGVQGFWIQMSNGPRIQDSNFKMARFWIQILNWTRFRIQNFSYCWDSNFKPLFRDSFFKHAGILDSNLKLMGFRIQIWAYRALKCLTGVDLELCDLMKWVGK